MVREVMARSLRKQQYREHHSSSDSDGAIPLERLVVFGIPWIILLLLAIGIGLLFSGLFQLSKLLLGWLASSSSGHAEGPIFEENEAVSRELPSSPYGPPYKPSQDNYVSPSPHLARTMPPPTYVPTPFTALQSNYAFHQK